MKLRMLSGRPREAKSKPASRVTLQGPRGHRIRGQRFVNAHPTGGRDHWGQLMSILIAGGGLKVGQVIGASNANGEVPSDRPIHPTDVLAMIYRHLGIPARHEFIDPSGRPLPVLHSGKPIRELI